MKEKRKQAEKTENMIKENWGKRIMIKMIEENRGMIKLRAR